MEAEASLLMANQAQAAPGKWIYDPFGTLSRHSLPSIAITIWLKLSFLSRAAGTGSMLLTAAGFGAMTFGSDIDGRQMRGKSESAPPFPQFSFFRFSLFYLLSDNLCAQSENCSETNIKDSAAQYGVTDRIVDCASFDMNVRLRNFSLLSAPAYNLGLEELSFFLIV